MTDRPTHLHQAGAVEPIRAGMLRLHHIGARSGARRVTPLAYWPVSDTSVAVLASNYGAERHPAWYHNLMAHPDAVVEIDGDCWAVRSRVAPQAERALTVDRIARSSGAVRAAISRTSRQIPAVVLELTGRLGEPTNSEPPSSTCPVSLRSDCERC